MLVISWSVFLWCRTFLTVPVSNLHICFLLSIHLLRQYFFWKKLCSSSLTNKAENKTNRNVERGSCSDVRTKNFTGNFSKLGANVINFFTNVCNKLECFSLVCDLFNSSCFQLAPLFLFSCCLFIFFVNIFSEKKLCSSSLTYKGEKKQTDILKEVPALM